MKRTGSAVALAAGVAVLGAALAPFAIAQGTDSPAAAEQESSAREPELILVKLHADWCPHCRALNTPWDALQSQFADEEVLFVFSDRTTPASHLQSEYLFAAMGLGDQWQSFGRNTGQILLFDAETKELIEIFRSSNTPEAMASTVSDALDA